MSGRSVQARLLGAVLFLSTVASGGTAPAAARPIYLHIDGPGLLPFSLETLQEAVSLRAAVARTLDPAAIVIAIESVLPDGVRVRSAAQALTISLERVSPAASARLIALAIVDLAREPEAAILDGRSTTAAPAVAPWTPRLSLSIAGGIEAALTNASPDPVVILGASYALSEARWQGSWRAIGHLGYSRSFSRNDPDLRYDREPVAFHTLPLRVAAGYRRRWFTLAGGLVARPYLTTGAVKHVGILPGAFSAATVAFPVSASWAVTVSAACELFAWRIDARRAAPDLFPPVVVSRRYTRPIETNHLAPSVVAGIQWR